MGSSQKLSGKNGIFHVFLAENVYAFLDVFFYYLEAKSLKKLSKMTFSLFPTIARLAGVEPGDEGEYECQVSTETKLSSIKHLQVIQPQV